MEAKLTDQPRFMLKEEVERFHPVNDRARKRAEVAGLFPRRVPLALHKVAWLRSEVMAWEADPRAWAQHAESAA
jgi:hypothetical protein